LQRECEALCDLRLATASGFALRARIQAQRAQPPMSALCTERRALLMAAANESGSSSKVREHLARAMAAAPQAVQDAFIELWAEDEDDANVLLALLSSASSTGNRYAN